MGRQLRRVAFDFNWPLNKPYTGFINPHLVERQKCPACNGDGYSPAGKLLQALWYDNQNEVQNILWKFRHELPEELRNFAGGMALSSAISEVVDSYGHGWNYHLSQFDADALFKAKRLWRLDKDGHHPTADEVNHYYRTGLGHDGINSWVCIDARAKKYGVSATCVKCNGECYTTDKDLEAKIAAWVKTEPPAGDGWQLWETTSEGSPISPVFETAEALASWLEKNGHDRLTFDLWLKFLNGSGHAFSFVGADNGVVPGVELAANITA